MKFLSCLWLVIALSCSHPVEISKSFNRTILINAGVDDKGIILSCYNCSCAANFISNYRKNTSISLYGDPKCLPISGLRALDQKILDSAYSENYNIVLFKNLRKQTSFRCLILRTEDAKYFDRDITKFFKE
jgi:hypothetical protein